jgi:hypothetical protein
MRFASVVCLALALFAMPATAQVAPGFTVSQDGADVPVQVMNSDWGRSYGITIGPRPFSISFPQAGCDPAVEATLVRVFDYDRGGDLVSTLVAEMTGLSAVAAIERVFPSGYGMAADAGPQRVLYAEDTGDVRFDQGFNYVAGDRYSAADADHVTLTVDRLELPSGDPLTAGVEFVLMVGRDGCPFDGVPINLIAVTFGAG